jgi:hypothetical protein
MSDLIAVGFKGEDTADQVVNRLRALLKEHLIDLPPGCVQGVNRLQKQTDPGRPGPGGKSERAPAGRDLSPREIPWA